MAKRKRRNGRRLIVISGLAAAGTGAAAAARAQRKRTTEEGESVAKSDESRMHRIAGRVKSTLATGREKLAAGAHKLRHPKGSNTA